MYFLSAHIQRTYLRKVNRLIGGLIIVAILFFAAIAMSRQPPIFDVQVLALQDSIDTSAFFYTDLD